MIRPFNDNIIGDIIGIKIDAEMSVSTLYALETIFYLRLQLAQASGEDNEPVYAALCRNRFEQLAKALMEKYPLAETLNEKIEILERIEAITLYLSFDHSYFALEEASALEDLPDLTFAQKLRLQWLPGIDSEDYSKIVSELLSTIPHCGLDEVGFVMATIAQIFDFITDEERTAVIDRYEQLIGQLPLQRAGGLGILLSFAADWNMYPDIRQRLQKMFGQHFPLLEGTEGCLSCVGTETGLSLPEKRVNAIAAEIYARLDILTGKYELVNLTA